MCLPWFCCYIGDNHNYRIYGSFTMESILANAFGRSIDIQGGEADELTKVAQTFFEQSEEGKLVSRDMLVMLASKYTFVPFAYSLSLSLSLSLRTLFISNVLHR